MTGPTTILYSLTDDLLEERANLNVEIDDDDWLDLVDKAAADLGVEVDRVSVQSPEFRAWAGNDACDGHDPAVDDHDAQAELYDRVTELAAVMAADLAAKRTRVDLLSETRSELSRLADALYERAHIHRGSGGSGDPDYYQLRRSAADHDRIVDFIDRMLAEIARRGSA